MSKERRERQKRRKRERQAQEAQAKQSAAGAAGSGLTMTTETAVPQQPIPSVPPPHPPVSIPVGVGEMLDSPKVADFDMLAIAFKDRYPMRPEVRLAIVTKMALLLNHVEPKYRIGAARVLLAADGNNTKLLAMAVGQNAKPQEHHHQHEHVVLHITEEVVTADADARATATIDFHPDEIASGAASILP